MIPIFVGWDKRETVAYHVLAHSIIQRSSYPVAITPVGNDTLPATLWTRPRGPHDSTDFSNARFMVPALTGYRGWAIFMDCDMLCLGDIVELWEQRDERYAVQVVKHRHVPTETTKFLGAPQSTYPRKNWSSVMLLNCEHPACMDLTPGFVNMADGIGLHGFGWCKAEEVGEIRGLWNVLVTERLEHPEPVDRFSLKLLHFTLGGPWHGYDPPGSAGWRAALEDLLVGENPCGSGVGFDEGPGVHKLVTQYQRRFDAPT
jgi:hypothetical protein